MKLTQEEKVNAINHHYRKEKFFALLTRINVTFTPTERMILAWFKDLQAYNASIQYLKNRLSEYGSAQEQLIMIYNDKINGTEVWSDHITAINRKHPKPPRLKDEEI
tara:strand:+ start:1469 stop:1789 length:321 start_codon:yes stop_codon:yes gene_type:complete